MKNSAYKKWLKALTAFFAIPVFLNFITMLDMFIFSMIVKTEENYILKHSWYKYDPIDWFFQHFYTPVLTFVWLIIAAILIYKYYRHSLKSKTKSLVYAGPALSSLLIAFWIYFSCEWFQLAADAAWLAYGITVCAVLSKEAKKLDQDAIIEEGYEEPSDARRINYYAMIFFFIIANLYWICFYGRALIESIKGIVFKRDGILYRLWTSKLMHRLFAEESSIAYIFITYMILASVALVTIFFYRRIL